MSTTGNTPADEAAKAPANRQSNPLDREPVDYAFLEEHLDELDLNPTYCETMEEEHQRQGAEMLRLLEFERNLDPVQQALDPRERFRLFLKQEGKHDREQRRIYLLMLRYDRQRSEEKFEG